MAKPSLAEKLRSCLEYHAIDGKLTVDKIVELMDQQLEEAYKRGHGKGVHETEQLMSNCRKARALEAGLINKKQPKYLRQETNKLGYKSVSVQQMLREE